METFKGVCSNDDGMDRREADGCLFKVFELILYAVEMTLIVVCVCRLGSIIKTLERLDVDMIRKERRAEIERIVDRELHRSVQQLLVLGKTIGNNARDGYRMRGVVDDHDPDGPGIVVVDEPHDVPGRSRMDPSPRADNAIPDGRENPSEDGREN